MNTFKRGTMSTKFGNSNIEIDNVLVVKGLRKNLSFIVRIVF